MSNSKSTQPRIEFKSDALSASAWTEAYYASEAFQRGRKGITDTKPHKPVKLSYSRLAAEEVLGDVRDKITHIRAGLLGPEERRGNNEQWIMELAEVEALFDEAIKKTAVEPMRTVTVELTQADLDAIALGLSLSYEDQASYLQNGDPTMDYAEDLEDTKKLKANQFRGIAAVAGRLGIPTLKELWEALAEAWESLEVHTDDPSTTLALKKFIDETPDPADWCEKCDDSVESGACGEGEDA